MICCPVPAVFQHLQTVGNGLDSALVPGTSSVWCVGFRAVWARRDTLDSFILFFFFKPGILFGPTGQGFSPGKRTETISWKPEALGIKSACYLGAEVSHSDAGRNFTVEKS